MLLAFVLRTWLLSVFVRRINCLTPAQVPFPKGIALSPPLPRRCLKTRKWLTSLCAVGAYVILGRVEGVD